MTSKCDICMEKNTSTDHEVLSSHLKNQALKELSQNRKQFAGNRKGVVVTCDVKSTFMDIVQSGDPKIKISVKPNEEVKFNFKLSNETRGSYMSLIFVTIPRQTLNFSIDQNGLKIGSEPLELKPKTQTKKNFIVKFKSSNIGQYVLPIFFLFQKKETGEKILIARSMIVYVENKQTVHEKMCSPYVNKEVVAASLIKTRKRHTDSKQFGIPKNYKPIYANDLKLPNGASDEMKEFTADIREIFETGITKENYIRFFHNLLWFEETIARINLKKYNMRGVHLKWLKYAYSLHVPGLAEKRPSLMHGDLLFVKPQATDEVMFEAVISEINENTIQIQGLDGRFSKYYNEAALFDIRFFMSRVPLERMHSAIDKVMTCKHDCRVFPQPNKHIPKVIPITEFFNPLILSNPEQRLAVEHIVAGTSGTAPFILHGPPGTGKTMTIVEAILQLVSKNASNRILVCTDSNMAADHVATMLIKYAHLFKEYFLLRANSRFRVWESMPECLHKYSNGKDVSTYEPLSTNDIVKYRIIITTLSHSAKYSKKLRSPPMSHLFVDEAAQAGEPACLVPCSLLRPGGAMVLAGDPLQLGPVVISHSARRRGLGTSLMERLMKGPLYNHTNMDSNYTVMLRNNFRSNEDIIALPNELFYRNQLRVCAKDDRLSTVDILGTKGVSRAVVFHGVLSKEGKMGKSPSYFNNMEFEIIQKYVSSLIDRHGVMQNDIGIVTPYIRQATKIRRWLHDVNYGKIEVGTVEAFQGKEKRVILISTVRANCDLLEYDAKFQLGFLVDDQRFNVAITRAKAKVVVVGNPLCLEKDEKWRRYIDRCRELNTYDGIDVRKTEMHAVQDEVLGSIMPLMKQLKVDKTK